MVGEDVLAPSLVIPSLFCHCGQYPSPPTNLPSLGATLCGIRLKEARSYVWFHATTVRITVMLNVDSITIPAYVAICEYIASEKRDHFIRELRLKTCQFHSLSACTH